MPVPYQKLFYRIVLLGVIQLFHLSMNAQVPCIATRLQCEHLDNPLGIDALHPRISWQLQDKRTGARQNSYAVIVGTDSTAVSRGSGNCWESGRMPLPSQLVLYQGKPLQPFTRYYYSVQVWDKDNQPTPWSAINYFETGMLHSSNWKGSWISDSRDVHLQPAPYFRKAFSIKKTIKTARAYIAVAGLYELYLNGYKISNHQLDPMYTRFDRRTLYVTHDVTSALQQGNNAVGVLLGNGWCNLQSTAVWYFHEAPWRQRPAFCMDIRITYTDGSVETMSTGKDWKTSLSPIVFNSIYTGEHQDARLEQPGWNEAGFNDSTWKEVMYRSVPSGNITAQVMHPIRYVDTIPAYSLSKLNDTTWVFNLGRNIAGISRLTVTGPAGTVLHCKHGERLRTDGHVDISNIDVHYRPTDNTDPFATDIYTLSGREHEVCMPHFNYKGFQYVEVTSSTPVQLTKESLIAYFMHSDVPVAGYFTTSNPTLNKLWWATNNSYLSNLFGYPTDCPQREKNGWTGDAHIASETGLYNFDGITIYEKWMADHRDEQQPNGILPSIIPTDGWGYEWGNGPDWTSTIAIIPWNLFQFYGDTMALSYCYDNIKRYVDHITSISNNGLTTWGLGDWVPVKSKTPVEFTSSVYYYVDANILAKTAEALHRQEDEYKYKRLAGSIKNAINNKYLDTATGIYGSGAQTELSVPLYWGVVPMKLIPKVAANLAKRVQADNNHIDVGLLGTKALLSALSENGYADVAYQLAAQETYPSWGWWVVNGATTLYENWNIDSKSDISLNHIMFGEIGAWLYKALGGIRLDPYASGFKNILLEPHFVAGLNQVACSHECPFGSITANWKRNGKHIIYTAVIPPNATATVQLPVYTNQKLYMNGDLQKTANTTYTLHLTAGTYVFEWK